jgi:hypothetical protein
MSEIEESDAFCVRIYTNDKYTNEIQYPHPEFGNSDFMDKHYSVWVKGMLERHRLCCTVHLRNSYRTENVPLWVVEFDTDEGEYTGCNSSYDLCGLLKKLEFKAEED